MGDRANVYVADQPAKGDQPERGVYLYTHWGGYELPTVVRDALAKRWRWDDPVYLARIVFDAMTEGDHGKETGFGIASFVSDNEHPIIRLDCEKQRVEFRPQGAEAAAEAPAEGTATPWHSRVRPMPGWSFEDYIALDDKALDTAWRGYADDEAGS